MNNTRKRICTKWLSVTVCIVIIAVLGILTAFALRPPTRITVYAGEITPASTTRPLFTGNTDAGTFTYNHGMPISVSERPMITVLTHGMGGRDSHWSNDGQNNFAYDTDSLIENLRSNSPNGARVYWARMSEQVPSSFYLLELQEGEYQYQRYIFTNMSSISHLTMDNLTRHMIIVFNSTNSARSNTNAVKYAEFRAMLTSIIADVGYITGGVYPKINLIGYSRGGLTNLEFAINHPRLICSVFNIGTPHFGSNFGRVNLFVELLDMGGVGLDNLQTEAEQNRLLNLWNNNFSRHSHINVYALAGYANVGFLRETAGIWGEIANALLNPVSRIMSFSQAIIMYVAPIIMRAEQRLGLPLTNYTVIVDVLASAIRLNVLDLIPFVPSIFPHTQFQDDGFVGLDSQRGISGNRQFMGFNNGLELAKRYGYTGAGRLGTEGGTNLSKRAVNNFPIPHNLQARDRDFINFITETIDTGFSLFDTTEIGSNEIRIESIAVVPQRIVLPSYINGRRVTQIGCKAFINALPWYIMDITLPVGIKYISSNVFNHFNTFSTITIRLAEGTTHIQANLFENKRMWNLEIPNTVTYVGYRAFAGASLGSVILPSGVTHIGAYAFTGFAGASITIPSGVAYIGINAFLGANVRLADGTTHIRDRMFENTGATRVTLPNTVTHIGYRSFADFTGSISMSSTVTYIGAYAFAGASLPTLNILRAEYIGESAFAGAAVTSTLFSIAIHANNTQIGYRAFAGFTGSGISLRSGVTFVGAYAFAGFAGESIGMSGGVENIGVNAFLDTTALVTLYSGTTHIHDRLFENTGASNISIPNTITHIGAYAFAGTSITELEISAGVTSVGHNAFADTPNNFRITWRYNPNIIGRENILPHLKEVILPNNITHIQDRAFENASNLTILNIGLNSILLQSIGEYAFAGAGITEINIPPWTRSIGRYAFAGSMLTGFSLSSGITYVGQNAFADTPNNFRITWLYNPTITGRENILPHLEEVILPNNITHIRDRAFEGVGNLRVVSFGSHLRSIGSYAFAGTGISEINIPNGVTEVRQNAFYNTPLLKIAGEDGLIRAGSWVIGYAGDLGKELTLDADIAGIADSALGSQPDLTVIRIESTRVIRLGKNNLCHSPLTFIFTGNLSHKNAQNWNTFADVIFPNLTFSRITAADAYAVSVAAVNSGNIGVTAFIPAYHNGLPVTTIRGFRHIWITGVIFEEGSRLTTIEERAFTASGLTDISLPETVTFVGHNAFLNTPMWRETPYNGIVYVSGWAVGFNGNINGLRQAEIIDDTIGIADRMFRYSGLESISLPDSIRIVKRSAFYNTPLWNNTPAGGVVFAGRWAVGVNGTLNGPSLTLRDTIGIAAEAFLYVFGLRTITIVQSYEDGILRLGSNAFSSMLNAINVRCEATAEAYREDPAWAEFADIIRVRIINIFRSPAVGSSIQFWTPVITPVMVNVYEAVMLPSGHSLIRGLLFSETIMPDTVKEVTAGGNLYFITFSGQAITVFVHVDIFGFPPIGAPTPLIHVTAYICGSYTEYDFPYNVFSERKEISVLYPLTFCASPAPMLLQITTFSFGGSQTIQMIITPDSVTTVSGPDSNIIVIFESSGRITIRIEHRRGLPTDAFVIALQREIFTGCVCPPPFPL